MTAAAQRRLPEPAEFGVVACGALAQDISQIAQDNGWSVRVYPLPPLLHNRPERIAAAAEQELQLAWRNHRAVALAYADCGTYGAIDDVCARWDVPRLGGQHCYDVYAGVEGIARLLEEEPGTYLLTDFLAASFHRSVWIELGLDRYPELRDDYFGNYQRVVWLTVRSTPLLASAATEAAALVGLPLEVVDVGLQGLTNELEQLLTASTSKQLAQHGITEVVEGIG